MRFSEQWLREWVNPAISTAELCDRLTMAGLEVDAVEPVAPPFDRVVVGEVLQVEPHPDAERLRVCQVSVGGSAPLTIVCGAANVAVGLKVPTALIGAHLPGDVRIAATTLRGVASAGMLCSAKELGLAETSEGLLVLPEEAEPGMDVRALLQLDDVAIELGLTPNRGDCLSILGVAREVAVACEEEITEPETANVTITLSQHPNAIPVELQAPEACPRYIGRLIKDINPRAETPLWMKERLRRAGLRSLGPVVDVTNYVMLETGQPMHAFDLNRISGGIRVRYALPGESLELLDGRKVDLELDTLVIADHEKPLAMAGIMGGRDSAVADTTVDLFLESAFFQPEAIAGRPRRYNALTDSAHRFERGVDPNLPVHAMKRATALLVAIVGGKVGPVIEAHRTEYLPERRVITLRTERLAKVLGLDLPQSKVTEMLTRLGMKVREQGRQWIVTVPPSRFDLAIEADLIEEVARVYGYAALPSDRPKTPVVAQLRREVDVPLFKLRQCLIARGYQEAITYSFVDPALQAELTPELEGIALANPIASDMAVMRTTLWTGLLQAVQYNQNRQQDRVHIFESGVKYIKQGNEIKEEKVVAGVAVGAVWPEQWGSRSRAVDFYDVKADVEALLGLTRQPGGFIFKAAEHAALHPGQTARIEDADGQAVGWIGALHPRVIRAFGLTGKPVVFEVATRAMAEAVAPRFKAISKFPAIRRDLALVVNEATSAQQLIDCIRTAAGTALVKLELFDVYQGERIESGKKSLAFGLTFQDTARTLTDQEIDDLVAAILRRAKDEVNATLRD